MRRLAPNLLRPTTVGALLAVVTSCTDLHPPTASVTPPDGPRANILGTTLEIIEPGSTVPRYAMALNDAGTVVGYAYPGGTGGAARAFVWSSGGGMQLLPTAPDWNQGFATGINEAGIVVGHGVRTTGRTHAFRVTPAGTMQDLTPSFNDRESGANDVNDAGVIVGWAAFLVGNNTRHHAALWRPNQNLSDPPQRLNALQGNGTSVANAINNAGAVVGRSDAGGNNVRPFLWTATSGMQDLGALQNSPHCEALDINEATEVVGFCIVANGQRAFRWTAATGMRDLGTLGGSFAQARAINDAGQIVGYSTTTTGEQALFFWTESDGMENVTAAGGATFAEDLNNLSQYVGGQYFGGVDFEPNVAPIALEASVTTVAGVPIEIILAGADIHSDPLQFTIVTQPAHGALQGTPPALTYTPQGGFEGADSFTFTVKDPKGLVSDPATVTISVLPNNRAPVASIGGPYSGDEGVAIVLSLAGLDPDGDELAFSWNLGDGTAGSGSTPPLHHTYADNGSYTLTLKVDDGRGGVDSTSTTVTVANVAPSAQWTVPGTLAEGGSFILRLTSPSDPSSADVAAGFTYSFDCGSGYGPYGTSTSASCPAADNGTLAVRAKIRDKDLGEREYSGDVVVTNVAPTLGSITAPAEPMSVGASVAVRASFTDPGVHDTHVAAIDWGDNSTTTGTITSAGTTHAVSATHAYASAGVYTVRATVTDKDAGVSNTSTFQYVVIYDPSAGFVTGGGWIQSPANACQVVTLCGSTAAGKATFGFVSRYQKGANVPTGNTQFQYHAGNFNFHSTSYEWLVIAGAKAQYKGSGTINGSGDYGFMITATDGDLRGDRIDRFRLKVWNKSTGAVIYDNNLGAADDLSADPQSIGGGSIQIQSR